MFKELAPLARKTDLFFTIMADEGDLLRVNLIPKHVDGTDAALSTPLSLCGTPDELDEKLAAILTSYSNTRLSLEESLENAKLIMEEAKKSSQNKATQKKTPVLTAKAAPVASDDAFGEDGDDENQEFGCCTESSASQSRSSKEEELDLFS